MITAIASAAATIVVALIVWLGNRKRVSISGAQEITNAALALVTPQVTRIKELQEELEKSEEECRTIKRDAALQLKWERARILQLELRIQSLGIKPPTPITVNPHII